MVKQKQPQTKVAADIPKNIDNTPTQELATLENNDSGYTVKYPTNFDALYTQNGVEFTPKDGKGKIILQVKDKIVDANIQQNQVEQPQLSMLNSAAETIKNSFQFTQTESANKNDNEGRFANIHFDPKKY